MHPRRPSRSAFTTISFRESQRSEEKRKKQNSLCRNIELRSKRRRSRYKFFYCARRANSRPMSEKRHDREKGKTVHLGVTKQREFDMTHEAYVNIDPVPCHKWRCNFYFSSGKRSFAKSSSPTSINQNDRMERKRSPTEISIFVFFQDYKKFQRSMKNSIHCIILFLAGSDCFYQFP